MSDISWPTPFGYTIFCDDIRYEIDGKQSFIGIYASEMIFSIPFPATLPKLGLSVKYYEKFGESTEPVHLEIYLPGDSDDNPTVRSEFDYKQMRSMPQTKAEDGIDSRIGAVMNAVLSPVHFTQEGYIKVRARRGDDIIRLGSLKVVNRSIPPDTNSTT